MGTCWPEDLIKKMCITDLLQIGRDLSDGGRGGRERKKELRRVTSMRSIIVMYCKHVLIKVKTEKKMQQQLASPRTELNWRTDSPPFRTFGHNLGWLWTLFPF